MTFQSPTLPTKFDALKEALEWASGCTLYWQGQNTGRRREAGEVWGEVRLFSMRGIGTEELTYTDTEDGSDNPVQVNQIGQRLLTFQLHLRSRSQAHASSAWLAGARAQQRLRAPYSVQTFLKPNQMSIAYIGTVQDTGAQWDSRIEDLAILEFSINTVLTDIDTENVTTYIEHIEASSGTKDVTGTLLPADVQWDEEVIP